MSPTELDGKILFSRGGGHYGDETVFTAAADGSNPKRITPFDLQCCAQWAPGGKQIFISASAPDDNEWMTGRADPIAGVRLLRERAAPATSDNAAGSVVYTTRTRDGETRPGTLLYGAAFPVATLSQAGVGQPPEV